MSFLEAILLGVIQGLTEFLPVSSSGHLVLFQKLFGVEEPALLFDTMLHVGTLVAVFAVLWKDVWAILRKLYQPLTAYLIIATVPTVIAALVFRKPLEKLFETGQFLGVCFLITSALLAAAELLSRRAAAVDGVEGGDGDVTAKSSLKEAEEMKGFTNPTVPHSIISVRASAAATSLRSSMRWLDALVIGIMQAIAIVPGVSRSGATLSGALSRRLNRDFAARFSFLLSIPAILGAAVFQLKDVVKGGKVATGGAIGISGTGIDGIGIDAIGMTAIIAGTITAAIVGFFAVRLMLKIVREKSLWGFAIYTGVLGLLVLIDQFGTHLVFK